MTISVNARVGTHSDPERDDGSEDDGRQEVDRELILACGNAAEVLQATKGSFDSPAIAGHGISGQPILSGPRNPHPRRLSTVPRLAWLRESEPRREGEEHSQAQGRGLTQTDDSIRARTRRARIGRTASRAPVRRAAALSATVKRKTGSAKQRTSSGKKKTSRR